MFNQQLKDLLNAGLAHIEASERKEANEKQEPAQDNTEAKTADDKPSPEKIIPMVFNVDMGKSPEETIVTVTVKTLYGDRTLRMGILELDSFAKAINVSVERISLIGMSGLVTGACVCGECK